MKVGMNAQISVRMTASMLTSGPDAMVPQARPPDLSLACLVRAAAVWA